MSNGEAGIIDAWSPREGLHAPPILLGAPAPGQDDGRWFLLADLHRLESGVLDRILREVEATRGYRDGQAQGGGVSLITSAFVLGIVFRVLDGAPMPALAPDATWIRITETANATAVRVDEARFLEPTFENLRGSLSRLLTPFYEALHQRTRFPVVACWAQVTSNIAYGLLNSPEVASGEALQFIQDLMDDDAHLQRVKPRIAWIDVPKGRLPYATRRVCCYNFRGKGGHYCGSQCPIVPAEERAAEVRRHHSTASGS